MGGKEQFGICHICGQYKKLSYEHIPPKGSFNPLHQRLYTVEELLNAPSTRNLPPWDTSGLHYKSFQNGTGFFTLCEDCNNFTGAKYGGAYSDIIRGIGQELMKIPKEDRKRGLTIHVEKVNLLAFFKQIISMFCSINSIEIGKNFKEFLLDENSNAFHEEYGVFMFLHTGRVMRFIPFQVQANVRTKDTYFFSEISTFPVGFILYDLSVSTKQFHGCDITSFSQCPYDNNQKAEMPLPFLSCNTPFGLDFREL